MRYGQITQDIQQVDLTNQLKNINVVRQKYPDVASMLPDLFRRQTPPRPTTNTASPTTVATRPANAQSTTSTPTNSTGSRPPQTASPPRASPSPASAPTSTNNRNGTQPNPAGAARPAQAASPSTPQSTQISQPARPPTATTPSNNSSTRASPPASKTSTKPGSLPKPGTTAKPRKAQADSKKNLMLIGIACGVGVLLVIIGVIIFKIRSSKRQQRLSVEQSQQAAAQFQASEGPHSVDYIRRSEEARPSFSRPPPTSKTTYPPLPPPGNLYPTRPNHDIYARESMEFYNPRPPPPILPRHEYQPHPREKQWRREPSTYDIDGYYQAPTSIASPTGQHIDARYTINEPDYDVMYPDERPYDPRYTLDRRGKLKYEIEENSSLGPPRSRYDSHYFGRDYQEEPEGSDLDAQSRYSYYPPEHLEVPQHAQRRRQDLSDPPGSSTYYNNSLRNHTRLPYE